MRKDPVKTLVTPNYTKKTINDVQENNQYPINDVQYIYVNDINQGNYGMGT